MVQIRRTPVKMRQGVIPVPYASPGPYGIEVMTLARLRKMAPTGYLQTPQRPAFHLLILGTAGQGRHTVDFRAHVIEPGGAVWVRPGQVQRFEANGTTEGDLVLFRPDVLIPGTRAELLADDRFGPVSYGAASLPATGLGAARRSLRRAYDAVPATANDATQAEVLRHLLSVLILQLVPVADDDGRSDVTDVPSQRLDRSFRQLLERDFAAAHDVEHYARALGYSTRSLSRATRAAGGETPKHMIQQRLALEAGRLLAHSSQPVAAVAAHLGFRDASNFAAFFTAQTGMSPTQFRSRERRQ